MSLRVAAVFSNNCVLQREKNINIFGAGEDGKIVEVFLFNESGKKLASNKSEVKNGKWKVTLPPQSAANNCSIVIQCEKEIRDFTNVAIGEVWLCGGQSNMEFELQNCKDGPEELSHTADPNVRFYYTSKIAWKDNEFYRAEERACWQTWDSEFKKSWSAVGFFFAKKLASDLGITVGLIGCNWGGTSATSWMDRIYLEGDADLNTYLLEYAEATKGKSIDEQCKEWDDYIARDVEWNKRAQEVYKEQPDIGWEEIQKIVGKNEWPGPKCCKSPFRPSGLYDCMVQRIVPYTLKGVLWYQGESDDHKPNIYSKLFSTLIINWRDVWNDPTLPFIFVQLPINRYKQDKDFKHWCIIREEQEKVEKTIRNTYMTVALDYGQFNDIHPKIKRPVGERMEALAMCEIYGAKIALEKVHSPTLKSFLPVDGEIILTFENAANGFVTKADDARLYELREMELQQGKQTVDAWISPAKLSKAEQDLLHSGWSGFEVAGTDGIFYPAIPRFGKNEIILSSPDVLNPIDARYAWFNYCPVTVFNKEGLPLAPFRTNQHEQLVTGHADIQQTMVVAS